MNDDSALMKWMVGGPKIADIIKSLRGDEEAVEEHKPKHHHEDTDTFEKKFRNEVIALRDVLDEHGNPFHDIDNHLIHIVSKSIMNEESVNSVKKANDLGNKQFEIYVQKRLIACEVPIYEKIQKNKLSLP